MSLRVDARFTSGNVAAVHVVENTIQFSASPCGGSEALWFYFRIIESAPDGPHPENVTLTLRFVRNMTGCDAPTALRPVHRGNNQGWNRTRTTHVTTADERGQPLR